MCIRDSTRTIDLVDVNFVEHGLLGEAEGVVTVAVELLVRKSTEVADTWQCHGQQTIEEFPHAVAAQGNLCADWHAFTELEVSDGLLRTAKLWLLTLSLIHI